MKISRISPGTLGRLVVATWLGAASMGCRGILSIHTLSDESVGASDSSTNGLEAAAAGNEGGGETSTASDDGGNETSTGGDDSGNEASVDGASVSPEASIEGGGGNPPDACATNVCGGCSALQATPGDACGQCGNQACDPQSGTLRCNDPGLNACGGCATLSAMPNTACGCNNQFKFTCSADKMSVTCNDPGANACGGCGALSAAPASACGTCGTEVCSADKTAVMCSDPGLNACGGCGTLAGTLNGACGACGTYACATKTSLTCNDPGLNKCGGCGTLAAVPSTACGTCGSYTCSADKKSVSCVGSTTATQCSGTQVETCSAVGQWNLAAACGGASACKGTACAIQLTMTGASVTATQTLTVTGPVGFVADTLMTDTVGSMTAQIDWGDATGKVAGTISGTAGAFTVSGAHTYGTGVPATVMITVTVNAPSGATASVTYAATVRPVSTVPISQFNPTESWDIAIGPDGNVWLTEEDHGNDEVTTAGVSTQYGWATTVLSEAIVKGVDGNLWFTASDSSAALYTIGRFSTTGVSGPRIPISGIADRFAPNPMTVGPDGNIWFTEGQGMIGRANTAGVVTEFPVAGDPYSITSGPDGNLWFTEPMAGKIGRMTPAGAVVELITLAATEASPIGITLGPDNNIWFTDSGTNPVVRLNPTTRAFTEFALPGEPGALGIAVGPDHNLWVTSSDVCRITPTGAVTNFGSNSFGTTGPIAGPDGLGNMWFVNDLDNIGRITP